VILPGIETSNVASWAAQWWVDRKNERLIKERIWNECILAVDCKFGETWEELEEYRSKRYMSLPWQAVETVSSSLVNGCMPSDWFSILGRTPADDQKSKLMLSLLKWQHFKTKFRTKFKVFAKSACITGNVPYCVDWREETIQVPDDEAMAAQMAYNQMQQSMGLTVPQEAMMNFRPTKALRAYDGPDFHIGNIFDYVQDLQPSNPRFALRAIKFFRSKAYLDFKSQPDENGYSLYQNIDQVSDENIFRDSSDSLKLMTERQIGIARMPEDMVELIQFEGDFEIPNGGGGSTYYPNHIMVVANRRTVIRFEPNPFLYGRPTWELFVLYPEPNETYGRGIIEPILGINDGIQVCYNQTIEARALIVNPGFKYKEDGVFDADEFISSPGMLVKCTDPANNVLPLTVPDKTMTGFHELDFAINQFNLVSGAQANFGGTSATEVSIEANQSKERLKETINHISDDFLADVLEREIALNQQLMDEPTWIRVVSDGNGMANDPDTGIPFPLAPQQMLVSPEEIVGQFDVLPVGANEVASDHQKAQELFQLTTAIMQSQMANAIKPTEFVNEVYKMAGFHNAWKFVKSPEEILFEQQQQFNQQLAMAEAEGMAKSKGGGDTPGQGKSGKTGPQPGPRGPASLPGMPEGPGALPGGPNPSQLAGNRLD